MKALTIKPHWAHAVAHLGKRCLNRSRPIPEALLGQRVAIHAGATLAPRWLAEIRAAAPAGSRSRWEAPTPLVGRHVATLRYVLQTRCIVATAVLGARWDPLDIDAREYVSREAWTQWGDLSAVIWWRLDDVRTLARPVPVARGRAGLWDLPADVAAHGLEEA